MRQMIDKHEAAAKASGARIVFSCGFDSVPFELGTFFVQEEAKRVFGAPAARVKGRVRDMRGTLSGGTAASAKATFDAVAKDPQPGRDPQQPVRADAGLRGPKQPRGSKPAYEEDLHLMDRAVHDGADQHAQRPPLQHADGLPYGRDFVYDEMVLTGPGEKGEANAKKVMALNAEKTGPSAPKPGEGPSKEERENGRYDLLYLAVAPDGRMVRAGIKGDRDPGYGSTSKMISECAICLLRDTPDVARRLLDAGSGDAGQARSSAWSTTPA